MLGEAGGQRRADQNLYGVEGTRLPGSDRQPASGGHETGISGRTDYHRFPYRFHCEPYAAVRRDF